MMYTSTSHAQTVRANRRSLVRSGALTRRSAGRVPGAALCLLLALTVALLRLPVAHAQPAATTVEGIPISAYDDDPFVRHADIDRMHPTHFGQTADGRPIMIGDWVWIEEEDYIYHWWDPVTRYFSPFAWNPWLPALREANAAGTFAFPDDTRFPLFLAKRDAEGNVVIKDGLQVWLPQDSHLAMTTAFQATHAARRAAEAWAGRDLPWGVSNWCRASGCIEINPHAFIAFNGFYNPETRNLFFGIVPYRLPGETAVHLFEMATSWELVAHEAGHALHHVLKPNADHSDQGYGTWTESFGDQMAMWASLRDRDRRRRLLAATHGDFNQSNALTRLGEVLAALIGEGTGIRDAFHDKKVSDTDAEVHDRSEVFSGASYRLFLTVYHALLSAPGAEASEALRRAGRIMGTFLVRAADFTPENRMTLADVARAYLKVDKEFYAGRYHAMLVAEFIRREIFDADAEQEWLAHEAAVPALWLAPEASEGAAAALVQAHLGALGIGPDFGLRLQSVTRDHRYGWTIVRVQLTEGRGKGAVPLNNHGILTFRRDGTLADYHAPLPSDQAAPTRSGPDRALRPLLDQAHGRGLDRHNVPLALVRRPDGQLTVETRVMRSEGLNAYMEVFTLEHPEGERREIVIPTVPPDRRLPLAADLLK